MKITLSAVNVNALFGAIAMVLLAGCATHTVPPLYTTTPKIDMPSEPQLLKVPVPPAQKTIAISINIPKTKTSVSSESAIMRRGAVVKAGSSVVISVPSALQRIQDASTHVKDVVNPDTKETIGFRTDGYFNVLEQYIERELIAAGFFVKDRSKFEAKLRDLRDGVGPANNRVAPVRAIAAQKVGDDKALSMDNLFDTGKQIFGELMSLFTGKSSREELFDTAEVIRAAQDGAVSADYVLQVNDLSVRHYTGEQLILTSRPEVQAVLGENPGLRVGVAENKGDAIPAMLAQPWMLAHFNAKLINVKTGTIEWIGDHSVESLAVLEDGLSIDIGGRRLTENAKTVVDGIVSFNKWLRDFYQTVQVASNELDSVYREVMQPVTYQGEEWRVSAMQEQRKEKAEAAERKFSERVKEYVSIFDNMPPESKMDWTYSYVIDQPTVTPDLANPKTEDDNQRLMKHVRALGSKITHDLLGTLKVTE